MTDPQRLLDSDVPSHIRALLEAGRNAEPRPSLVETALQSLSITDLGTQSSGLSTASSGTVIKVVAGVLGLGVAVGAAWTASTRVPAPPPADPRPIAQVAPATTPSPEKSTRDVGAPSVASARTEMFPAASADDATAPGATSAVVPRKTRPKARTVARAAMSPPASAASATVNTSREASRSSTTAQRDLVLRARAALDGGAPQQTLTMLAAYETSFDELRFVPEVLSLRMQAHQRVGNVKAAELLARRIIAMYPRSSQARRARQVLGDESTARSIRR